MGDLVRSKFFTRDRFASTLTAMTLAGVIDWSAAKPTDRDWQLKLRHLLAGYKTNASLQYHADVLRLMSASISAKDVDAGAQHKKANEILIRVDQIRRPWQYLDSELLENQPTPLETYEAYWGSLDDPEYQRKIEEATQAILNGQ